VLVVCLLRINGSLVHDLLTSAIAIYIFAVAICGGEAILVVRLAVFWALAGVMTVTTAL
jgi:hypothetical protein